VYVVMNRLQCARSYAEHMERAFGHAGNLEGVSGCTGFQFLRRADLSPESEFAEFIALTQWRDEHAYSAWVKGESFANAHVSVGTSPIAASIECFELMSG
jgi:heme-degrading monooxygenase HmoA